MRQASALHANCSQLVAATVSDSNSTGTVVKSGAVEAERARGSGGKRGAALHLAGRGTQSQPYII